MAFGSDGFLYLGGPPPGGGDRVIYRVNPSTGAIVTTTVMTPVANSIADFGSCASPNVISAVKTLDARALPTDQFGLAITGGSITQGNTGTTDGTDTGLQNTPAEMAGPVIGVPGQTYTVTESAANTTFLTSYSSSWSCFDSISQTTVGSGAGVTGTFTMPNNGSAGSDVVCTFDNVATPPDLTITKTSSAPADARPGDVVDYTVTATNTGTGPFTAANPAVVLDDLSDVIDDAAYNGDAASNRAEAPAYSSPRLSWSGALPVGESVTLTYSVTLGATGNGLVRNVAWHPNDPGNPVPPACDPPDGDGDDPVTGEACAEAEVLLPRLSISKSADQTELPVVGATVEYTLTVRNEGPGAYTAAAPATATDDLADVLDAADYNGDVTASTGDVDVTGSTLSWSGALAAGAEATITYSVTYTGEGDQNLRNLACIPDGDAAPGASPCAFVQIPGAGLTQWKQVQASSTPTVAGTVLTYTLFFSNDGEAAASVDATDQLVHVLDDADVTTEPSSANLTAVRTDDVIAITGSVPSGETYAVTYAVTVRADGDRGDSIAANFLMDAGETPPADPECTPVDADLPDCTSTPVSGLTYTKSVVASDDPVRSGTELAYTITIVNTGATAQTVGRDDDLSDVLDDTTITVDPASDTASVTVDGPTNDVLELRGTLPAGATAEVTYTVVVNDVADRGDDRANNYLVDPGADPPTSCDPATLQCTTTPIQQYTVAKSASAATVAPDGTVTYTVTVTNTGTVAYTDANPASFTDDLSEVLDDATYNADGTSSTGTGVSYTEPELSWSGPLDVGAVVTVTYSVTVGTATTDGILTNAVAPTAPGGDCDPEGACTTEARVSSFTVEKTADVTTAMPGDTVTYTVAVTNTGVADYTATSPASFTDDLSGVLDDATYNDDVSSGGSVTDTTLTWSGPLAVGATIEITYSVTVDDPATGDSLLANAVTPAAPGGTCEDDGCTTATPIASYTVNKTASATTAMPGDVITYTVTVTNTGDVAYTATDPASFTDDLSDFLDAASYNDDATGGATAADSTLTWSGALAAGATIEITYSVTVDDPITGDFLLTNAVTPTGPGGTCADICTTTTPVGSLHVVKTTTATEALPGDVIDYTITVTNTGQVAYTDAAPASFADDLTAVLDDAAYNDDAVSDSGSGVAYTDPTLSWSGPLAVGASVTITYSVTVTDPATGDRQLDNTVVTPPGTGGNCETGSTDPDCTATVASGSFTVEKTADVTTAMPGDTVTYTVTVTNTGAVAYTGASPASFTDDLSGVLDDATYNDDVSSGGSVTDTTLTWSGPLAVGGSVTVTYSVTVNDPATGDASLANAVTPAAPGGACLTDGCTTVTPVASYTVTKAASAATAMPGDVITYTVTVTNTGDVAYTATDPASVTDDLSDVLDDASYNDDATGGATAADSTLTWSGLLDVGATIVITYSVTVDDPITGDFLLTNAVTPTGPGGTCADICETTTPIGSYTVSKAASTATVVPGGTVEYTVTVTNTGQVAYTDAEPASFVDDLSAVLDDAAYNGDGASSTGAGTVGYTAPALTWSGPLAVGANLVVTYSVTVDASPDDGILTNAVTPTGAGGACTADDECSTETLVSSFTVEKSADATTALPGDVLTYTVIVTNTGAVAYTAGTPASFTDDLTAVLDDATYNDDASAGASVTDTTLTWSGPLAVGGSVAVTYSVTVNDPATGDANLANAVVPAAPGGTCVPDECATVTPVGSYTVAKTAGTATTMPGEVVTYTVTVTNTGAVDYTDAEPATFTDDLSGVLDDASYNDDASTGAAVTGTTLTWSGAVAAGASVVVTYSVTVDDPITGDFALGNAVTPTAPGGTCADVCETTTPIGSLRVVKTTDAADALPGDVIDYTITVTNTGQVAYTDATPASFTDSLTAVLDDATYNADATSTSGAGVTYTAPTLSWSGPLDVGADVTITYSVTVNDPATGDRQLDNAVVTPPGTGGNCEADSTDPACVANVPSGSFSVEKTVDATSAAPGDVVTYSVTVTNTGAVDYTEAEPASFTDDLSRVLDDATYNDDVSAGGTVVDTTLTWSGPLAVGADVVVTYSVTVDDPVAGDFSLRNVVTPSAPGGECVEGGCLTDTPVASYTVAKSADVTDVNLGGIVVYTVTVTNIGQADYTDADPASFTDDLSGVFDDATYNGDAPAEASVAANTLTWADALPAGGTVTVTYSVTVNSPGTGDGFLRNAVAADGPGGGCADEGACATETPVAAYQVRKAVSTTRASVGDRVTFTITVTNTGQTSYTAEQPASFTDDLGSALAIGTYNGDATSGATYTRPVLAWSGALEPGASASVTCSVTVRQTGDILNVVVTPDGSGANCAPGSAIADCRTTTTVVPPGLAVTGGTLWGAGDALAIMLLGLGLLLMRRRRNGPTDVVPSTESTA